MIYSSHRKRKTKAMAEVLAMIAAVELAPHRQSPFREIEEGFQGESATEFIAALEKYCAARTHSPIKLPKKGMV
jgi:hypothetical protein